MVLLTVICFYSTTLLGVGVQHNNLKFSGSVSIVNNLEGGPVEEVAS